MRATLTMRRREILTACVVLLALALPAAEVGAVGRGGAIAFSQVRTQEVDGGVRTSGGIYLSSRGQLVQLSHDPADRQPAFSPDGRAIAFVRDGDVHMMRADGTGERPLTHGPALDSRPLVSPNGSFVLFERAPTAGAPRDLFTVRVGGGGVAPLAPSPLDEREATFSPNGRAIAFVRGRPGSSVASDDIYSVRPSGAGLRRLTRTAQRDELSPRYFARGVVFSAGQSEAGPGRRAAIHVMRADGTRQRALTSKGSAHVADVSADGRRLLVRRRHGLWVKVLVPLRGRITRISNEHSAEIVTAAFSPDGRYVAEFVEASSRFSEGPYLTQIREIRLSDRSEVNVVKGDRSPDEIAGRVVGVDFAWQPLRRPRR